MNDLKKEVAKRVITKNLSGETNGWLLELFKDKDNNKTEVYLTVTSAGSFKGYHLHRVRETRLICLKGKIKVYTYININDSKGWVRKEYVLNAEKPERLIIPKNIAIGLENIGGEEAWLINYPKPPYDPNLKDEQIEYTKKELEEGIVK
jgi:dTDP-4-dehydrorhamnose 3,5-epimerase-like enzyme